MEFATAKNQVDRGGYGISFWNGHTWRTLLTEDKVGLAYVMRRFDESWDAGCRLTTLGVDPSVWANLVKDVSYYAWFDRCERNPESTAVVIDIRDRHMRHRKLTVWVKDDRQRGDFVFKQGEYAQGGIMFYGITTLGKTKPEGTNPASPKPSTTDNRKDFEGRDY